MTICTTVLNCDIDALVYTDEFYWEAKSRWYRVTEHDDGPLEQFRKEIDQLITSHGSVDKVHSLSVDRYRKTERQTERQICAVCLNEHPSTVSICYFFNNSVKNPLIFNNL